MTKRKIGLIAFAAVAAILWFAMTLGPLSAIKVTTDQVRLGTLSNQVFGVGEVEAKRSYNLAPTLTGRINRILVDQGDQVSAGQLLAEMDPVDLDDRLISSQRASERAGYAIQMAQAQLNEANSRASMANATYQRYFELRVGGYVSEEMLSSKLHEKNAAVAAQDAATASLAAANKDQTKSRADASGIAKQRSQIRLVSPINGIVSNRLGEPGTTVVSGQTVLQVIDPSNLWVRTRIDQKQSGLIHAEQPAQIVLRSQPRAPLTGSVDRIDMIGDAVTEERIVNVKFTASQPIAAVGELAEVTINLPDMKEVLYVPSASVKRIDRKEGVWKLQSGQVQFQPVTTGIATLDGRTQILSGLKAGDDVIVYSQQQLHEKSRIKVVTEIVRGNP